MRLFLLNHRRQKKFGRRYYAFRVRYLPIFRLFPSLTLLDAALGIGGVPRGRIVEIYGPESSVRQTFSLEILAEAQALGGVVAFIDAEHALGPGYAARIGVDIDDVLIPQPDTGEQALRL